MNSTEQMHEITCGPTWVKCTCDYETKADDHDHAVVLAIDHAKDNRPSLIQHEQAPNTQETQNG